MVRTVRKHQLQEVSASFVTEYMNLDCYFTPVFFIIIIYMLFFFKFS